MSEHTRPIGQPRDVPPPRPVGGAGGAPVEGEVVGGDSGLGPAARALAEAVAGLLGRDTPAGQGGSATRAAAGAKVASGVLADVIGAVAAAARSAGDPTGSTAGSRPGTGRRGRSGDREQGGRSPGGLLTELLDAAAPRLPIRDRERLRRAHPGATDDEIAEALAARAARLTGAIGAATGGLAAAQRLVPSALVAVPLELAAQTLLVGAVEVVLVGELHELAGRPAPGDPRARAATYVSRWQARRIAGSARTSGLASVLGAAGASAFRRQANRRLARGRSATAPLVLGASLAARANRKDTVALARELWAELRGAQPR